VLTVESLNGCVVSDTVEVLVHAIPEASFLLTDPCMNSPYTFTDNSSVLLPDTIMQWIWNFGALGTSTLKNPLVTFPDSTDYNITLFVQSNAGCNNTISQDIHVNPSPVAAFLPDYFYGTAPFTVVFTNNSQGATNYSWHFGDGDSSYLPDPPGYTYTYNDSFKVQLIAYNQYGCSSTAYQELMVIPTIADIAVTEVDTLIQGNYVSLSAKIANYGSQRIYNMYISAEPQGGSSITESWTDMINPLEPGGTMTYHFNGKYSLSELQETDYICVDAQIVNEIPDNNPSNNVQCFPFKDQFIAYDPYPSPVNDQYLHIDFILPLSGNVDITLYGTKGDLIAKIYSGMAAKGINMLTIDVSSLSIGIYTYRITYRDEQKILRFVKF
jgi:PKD repeat protein